MKSLSGHNAIKREASSYWQEHYTQSVAARYEKLFPIFALHRNQRPRLGYMDLRGKTIIAPRFSSGLEFLEGRAPVQISKKWRFINDSGEWAFDGEFGIAERFSEGLAYVIAAPRKYGFIDVNGNISVEPLCVVAENVFSDR
jgi:hypothetical protein